MDPGVCARCIPSVRVAGHRDCHQLDVFHCTVQMENWNPEFFNAASQTVWLEGCCYAPMVFRRGDVYSSLLPHPPLSLVLSGRAWQSAQYFCCPDEAPI